MRHMSESQPAPDASASDNLSADPSSPTSSPASSPDKQPRQEPLASYQAGQAMKGTFRVIRLTLRETPKGKPFLLGEVADASRRMGLVCWHPPKQGLEQVLNAGYLLVQGTVDMHRDRLQIQAKLLALATPDDELTAELAEQSDSDMADLWQRFDQLVQSVQDTGLQQIVTAIVTDKERREALATAPAAVTMHHARPGGLLEHTVSVSELADLVCQRYPQLDRDLVVAAALLHDICKLDELNGKDNTVTVTPEIY